MAKTGNERIADKIVSLLADSRITSTDWRVFIPFYITRHNKYVLAHAKSLADGINEVMAEEEIGIPVELLDKYKEDEVNARY